MVERGGLLRLRVAWILWLLVVLTANAQSNDDDLSESPVASSDDDSSPTFQITDDNPVAAPILAQGDDWTPSLAELKETPEPSPYEEETREPTPDEKDTAEPTPYEEDTPDPTPYQEDTPQPTPSVEETPEPTPYEEDTPEPTPYEEDTPEPTPNEEDTPEPTPYEEDTPEPTPSVEETPEPSPYEEETREPTPDEKDTAEPTPYEEDTPEPTPYEEDTAEPTPNDHTPTASESGNPPNARTPWPTDIPTRVQESGPVASPVAGTTDSPTMELFERPVAGTTDSPTRELFLRPAAGTTDSPTRDLFARPYAGTTELPTREQLAPPRSPVAFLTSEPMGQPKSTPSPTSKPTASSTTDPTPPSESPTTSPPSFDASAGYFDDPEELWVISLNNFLTSSDLEKGNAVAVSPDGVLIYITRNRGRLDVHSAIDGSFRFTVTPSSAEPDYFPLECHSGVVFATLETGETTALYAVIDMPPGSENSTLSDVTEATSRIVAIAHPVNQLLWVSEPLPGIIEGTPVVTRGTFPGRYMFVTHNTNTLSSSEQATGHFSVLDLAANGKVIFTERLSDVDASHIYPYGPLGVSHVPNLARFDSLFSNTNDIVVWTSTTKMGSGELGFIRGFQLPANLTSLNEGDVKTVQIVKVGWNAVARPTFSEDGQSMFIGMRQSVVRGWATNSTFNKAADWSISILSEPSDSLYRKFIVVIFALGLLELTRIHLQPSRMPLSWHNLRDFYL